ncbi:MAG: hypothetical protein HYS06_01410 [Methylocystis sp.]|nr:hypothetical protein [Methylocystis sp.]MBI3275149.1 hypothetical protein [Methylocystis sp.]
MATDSRRTDGLLFQMSVCSESANASSSNLIEQINQTFPYRVALLATAWLLDRRPDAGRFRLAPGANAALPLDVTSMEPDLVGVANFGHCGG